MIPSNVQKIPIGLSLNQAMARSAQNRAQLSGKCLPCSVVSVDGAIVTVNFEVNADRLALPQVQMPLFGPEYIRYPLQKGDKGFAISADAYLGQMSGLGNGTADLSVQPNLSTLAFMPCGNKNWRSVDPDVVTIYGKNGVTLEDGDAKFIFSLTASQLTISANGTTIFTLDSSGNLTVTGNVTWGATPTTAETHHHSGVSIGAAQSGPPVPGT